MDIWRQVNWKTVYPWLVRGENLANRVQVDNHEDLFGIHPSDSVEVISDKDQSVNPPQGLTACHVVMESGVLSSDEDNYYSDNKSSPSLASRQDP